MFRRDNIEDRFEARAQLSTIRFSPVMTETGLVLGAGTHLFRMFPAKSDKPHLVSKRNCDRCVALISVVARRYAPSDILHHIQAASEDWQRGDKALANIRLAFAGLPRLQDRSDAYRLWLAETLLDDGFSSDVLMKELGLNPTALGPVKFDENQPRVPAGSGRSSGQWTRGGAASDASEPSRVTISEATDPIQEAQAPFIFAEPPVVPPLPDFPTDPTLPPGPGYIWRGAPGSQPGDPKGSFYNPDTGESLRPDLNHEPPIAPHYDYKAPDGTWYRWFPDGTMQLKGGKT